MLEGFSGTLVLVDELIQWPQLDARSHPEIAAPLLGAPRAAWHDLSRFALSRRTVRQRDLQATVRHPHRRSDPCCNVTVGVDLTDQEITDIATGYAYRPGCQPITDHREFRSRVS